MYSSSVFRSQSLSAPIMLMGHVPVCLQAFLGKGTAGIGEYPFVESNPCGCLRFELPSIRGSLSHTFFDLAEVQF